MRYTFQTRHSNVQRQRRDRKSFSRIEKQPTLLFQIRMSLHPNTQNSRIRIHTLIRIHRWCCITQLESNLHDNERYKKIVHRVQEVLLERQESKNRQQEYTSTFRQIDLEIPLDFSPYMTLKMRNRIIRWLFGETTRRLTKGRISLDSRSWIKGKNDE